MKAHTKFGTEWCETGKIAYGTRKDAATRAQEFRKSTGDRLRPYQCPFCPFWHLGHRPNAVIRGDKTADVYYGREGLS